MAGGRDFRQGLGHGDLAIQHIEPDAAALVRGLDDDGFAQGGHERVGRGLGGASEGDLRNRRDARPAHGALGGDLVHAEPVGDGGTTGKGDAAGFHLSLGAAVLAPATVQGGQDDVLGAVEPIG